MAKFSSLFSQILEFFPHAEFERRVRRFEAEKGAKGFTCRQQLVAMLFCQLGRAHSLREITDGLATCEGKLRHLGIAAPGRSTLAYANAHRPWKLYEALFYDVLGKCQAVARTKRRSFKFKNKLYSLDSTVIDLCLSAFDWAKFRRTKGAVKLHLRLDHDGCLPEFGLITEGAVHDVKALEHFRFQRGSIYVFDRGYNDYGWFGKFCQDGVFFVTRLKDNAAFEVVEHGGPSHGGAVVKDDRITFTGYKAGKDCPL